MAKSNKEDWERLALSFETYTQLVTSFVPSKGDSPNSNGNNEDGPLTRFRKIAEEIIDCAEDNNYGHYFEELEVTKGNVNKLAETASDMAEILRRMHEEVMQNVDKHVFKGLERIYSETNSINEGDNAYTSGTHEEARTVRGERGETHTVKDKVGSTLEYYLENEDTSLGQLYKAYEETVIADLEKYKPEGYKENIAGLKTNETSLYIGSVGAYNKKLDEGDWRNHLNTIVIGLAVVVTIALVIATAGIAIPAIMGAVGISGLTGAAAFGTSLVVGVGYGTAIGLGIGTAIGVAGYVANTRLGEEGYALDGTYLSKESKSDMFNQYVIETAKAAAGAGALAGAAAAGWIVDTTIDAYDLIKAYKEGDTLGKTIGWGSIFMSRDDIMKSIRKTSQITSDAKVIDKLDDVKIKNTQQIKNQPIGEFGDKTIMMQYFKDTDFYNSYTDMLKKTKPSYSPKPETWFKNGGTIEIMSNGEWIYKIKKNGVEYAVTYVDGVPQFPDEYLYDDLAQANQEIELTGNRELDEKAADAKAEFGKGRPEGYTWHHDMPCGVMKLVKTEIHKMFTHKGGFSLCRK